MNFRKKIDSITKLFVASPSPASNLSKNLKLIYQKYGSDMFKSREELETALNDSGLVLDNKEKYQLLLLVEGSSIGDFISKDKSDISLVDIDNIIHKAIKYTGLNYKTVIYLISDILYACGLNFPISNSSVLEDDKVKINLHSLMPIEDIKKEYERAIQMISACKTEGKGHNEENLNAAIMAVNNLCKSGVAEGFFLLGQLYYYGDCGTAKDIAKAKDFLKISADSGYSPAAGALGDIYYETKTFLPEYTEAHYYYTRPGALALSEQRQQALKDIYAQRDVNIFNFISSLVAFALTLAFTIYFRNAVFSGAPQTVVAVLVNVISALITLICILYYRANKYDNIRGFIFLQYASWAIYAFVFLLA